MEKNNDYNGLSTQLSILIRKEIDYALNNETKIQSAVVDYVTDDGVLAVHFPPSTTIYTGVMNQSIYKFKPGASVKVLKEKNNTSNMWVIGSFNENQQSSSKNFISINSAETEIKKIIDQFGTNPLSVQNNFSQEYNDTNNILENFLATCEFSGGENSYGSISSSGGDTSSIMEQIDILNGLINQTKSELIDKINNIKAAIDGATLDGPEIIDSIAEKIVANQSSIEIIANGLSQNDVANIKAFVSAALQENPMNNWVKAAVSDTSRSETALYFTTLDFGQTVDNKLYTIFGNYINNIATGENLKERIKGAFNSYLHEISRGSQSQSVYDYITNQYFTVFEDRMLIDSIEKIKDDAEARSAIDRAFTEKLRKFAENNEEYKTIASSIADWMMSQEQYSTARQQIIDACQQSVSGQIGDIMKGLTDRVHTAAIKEINSVLKDPEVGLDKIYSIFAKNLLEDRSFSSIIYTATKESIKSGILEDLKEINLPLMFGYNVDGEDIQSDPTNEAYRMFFQTLARVISKDITDRMGSGGLFDLSRNDSLSNSIITELTKSEYIDSFADRLYDKNKNALVQAIINDNIFPRNNVLNPELQREVVSEIYQQTNWTKFLNAVAVNVSSSTSLLNSENMDTIIRYIITPSTLETKGGYEDFIEKFATTVSQKFSMVDLTPYQQQQIANAITSVIQNGDFNFTFTDKDRENIVNNIGENFVTMGMYQLTDSERSELELLIQGNLFDERGQFIPGLAKNLATELAKQLSYDDYSSIMTDIKNDEECRESFFNALIEKNMILIGIDQFSESAQLLLAEKLGDQINLDNISEIQEMYIYNGIGQQYFNKNKDDVLIEIKESESIQHIADEVFRLFDADENIRNQIINSSSGRIASKYYDDAGRIDAIKNYIFGDGFNGFLDALLSAMSLEIANFPIENRREMVRSLLSEYTKEDRIPELVNELSQQITEQFLIDNKKDFLSAISDSFALSKEGGVSVAQNISMIFLENDDTKNSLIQGAAEQAGKAIASNTTFQDNLSQVLLREGNVETLIEAVSKTYRLSSENEEQLTQSIVEAVVRQNSSIINAIDSKINVNMVSSAVVESLSENDRLESLRNSIAEAIVPTLLQNKPGTSETYLENFLLYSGFYYSFATNSAESILNSMISQDGKVMSLRNHLLDIFVNNYDIKDIFDPSDEVWGDEGSWKYNLTTEFIRSLSQNMTPPNYGSYREASRIIDSLMGTVRDQAGKITQEYAEDTTQAMKYLLEKLSENNNFITLFRNNDSFFDGVGRAVWENEQNTNALITLIQGNVGAMCDAFMNSHSEVWIDDNRYTNPIYAIFGKITEEQQWQSFIDALTGTVTDVVETPFTSIVNTQESWNASDEYYAFLEEQEWNKKIHGFNNEFIEYNIENYTPYSHEDPREVIWGEDHFGVFYRGRTDYVNEYPKNISKKVFLNQGYDQKWRIENDHYVARIGIHLPVNFPMIFSADITVSENSTGVFAAQKDAIEVKYLYSFTEMITFGENEGDKIEARGFYVDVHLPAVVTQQNPYNTLEKISTIFNSYSNQGILSLNISIKGGM